MGWEGAWGEEGGWWWWWGGSRSGGGAPGGRSIIRTHPRLVELEAHQRGLVVEDLDAEDRPLAPLLVDATASALQ